MLEACCARCHLFLTKPTMPRRGQSARYEEYWEDDDEAYWQTEYAEEEEEVRVTRGRFGSLIC